MSQYLWIKASPDSDIDIDDDAGCLVCANQDDDEEIEAEVL